MLKNRRMRVISANMFVTSLAISDFALAALSSFSGFAVVLTSRWPYSQLTCQFQGYLAITLAIASMQTLALMALNRYFWIVNPKRYRRYFSKKKTILIICASWLYSSLNIMIFHVIIIVHLYFWSLNTSVTTLWTCHQVELEIVQWRKARAGDFFMFSTAKVNALGPTTETGNKKQRTLRKSTTLRSEPPFFFLIEEEKRRLCLIRVNPLKLPRPERLD